MQIEAGASGITVAKLGEAEIIADAGFERAARRGDLAVGDRLEVIPLHICSCVNLFDMAAAVRNGNVDRKLIIAGRGKVR